MNLRPAPRESADINLTPLIDVVFLLLIFFMVSTTFDRDSELSIELPAAAAEVKKRRPDAIEVAIDVQGRFYVNGRPLLNTQSKTLRQALRSAAGESESPPIIISADAKTPHQAVVRIMDAARELGFVRLTFATRLVPESDR
jgi:biopolymer transport protein ExbD